MKNTKPKAKSLATNKPKKTTKKQTSKKAIDKKIRDKVFTEWQITFLKEYFTQKATREVASMPDFMGIKEVDIANISESLVEDLIQASMVKLAKEHILDINDD